MTPIILKFQKNEITEHHVYQNFAKSAKGKNVKVLEAISKDELRHYNMFKKNSGSDVAPDRVKIFWYSMMGAIFGITFASKLMENGKKGAQVSYVKEKKTIKNISAIIRDAEKHEKALLAITLHTARCTLHATRCLNKPLKPFFLRLAYRAGLRRSFSCA